KRVKTTTDRGIMLIVISDIHLAESQTNRLGNLLFNRNLPAIVYRNYFQEIAFSAEQNGVKKVDLVLAGDIFEMNRTGLWLQDNLRPYLRNEKIQTGSNEEQRILDILDAIAEDERVSETLEVFRALPSMFGMLIQVHYIPGNHDRLVNSSQAIREKARIFLGLEPNNDLFPNIYEYHTENGPLALVRHGHEYDPVNFGMDVTALEEIPMYLPQSVYERPVLGNISTVEIATKLPIIFKMHYTANKILRDENLRSLYQRLIEFDDVRPSSALLNFLFSTPGIKKKETWRILEPVFVKIIRDIAESPYLVKKLEETANLNLAQSELIKGVLNLDIWHDGIPYWVIKRLMKSVSKNIRLDRVEYYVIKEKYIKEHGSGIRCVITGHTHSPEVELLTQKEGIQKYYINSGTWRSRIPSTPDLKEFDRLRSMTKVFIFGSEERDSEFERKNGWSFDFSTKLGYRFDYGD
ncbi:MAG: metallophosphoesterase, partial [Chloroflexota bacterium]